MCLAPMFHVPDRRELVIVQQPCKTLDITKSSLDVLGYILTDLGPDGREIVGDAFALIDDTVGGLVGHEVTPFDSSIVADKRRKGALP